MTEMRYKFASYEIGRAFFTRQVLERERRSACPLRREITLFAQAEPHRATTNDVSACLMSRSLSHCLLSVMRAYGFVVILKEKKKFAAPLRTNLRYKGSANSSAAAPLQTWIYRLSAIAMQFKESLG